MKNEKIIPDFYEAKISIGVYNTKVYRFKMYKTKSGLAKAMASLGYKGKETFNGEQWSNAGSQYTISFQN